MTTIRETIEVGREITAVVLLSAGVVVAAIIGAFIYAAAVQP